MPPCVEDLPSAGEAQRHPHLPLLAEAFSPEEETPPSPQLSTSGVLEDPTGNPARNVGVEAALFPCAPALGQPLGKALGRSMQRVGVQEHPTSQNSPSSGDGQKLRGFSDARKTSSAGLKHRFKCLPLSQRTGEHRKQQTSVGRSWASPTSPERPPPALSVPPQP